MDIKKRAVSVMLWALSAEGWCAQMFNAYSEMSIMVGGLAGFYKQRDSFFYPAWAASLPTALLRLPYSFVESLVLSCIIYWVSGLAPEPAR